MAYYSFRSHPVSSSVPHWCTMMQALRGSRLSFIFAFLLLTLQFHQVIALPGLNTQRNQPTCLNLQGWPFPQSFERGLKLWNWLGQSVGEVASISDAGLKAIDWILTIPERAGRPDDDADKTLRIGRTIESLFGGSLNAGQLREIRGMKSESQPTPSETRCPQMQLTKRIPYRQACFTFRKFQWSIYRC